MKIATDFGKTISDVDLPIHVELPHMDIRNKCTLAQEDFDTNKLQMSELLKESKAMEVELTEARAVITSLREEKLKLENQLKELVITAKAKHDELEETQRELHNLQRDLKCSRKSQDGTNRSLGSAQTETSEQTLVVHNFRTLISNVYDKSSRQLGDLHVAGSFMSTLYSKSRDDMMQWLNDVTSSVGDSHKWLETGSQIVVANCDFFLLLVEILIALLCVDFLLSAFLNRSQERIVADTRRVSSSHSTYS